MPTRQKIDTSVRGRLLATADKLFYAEGIHTVGIDRILADAGVAKASLYTSFGSKEDLVRAYLEMRALRRQEAMLARIAQHARPQEKILSLFDLLAARAAMPAYRGCPFINACAEGTRSESRARTICTSIREWGRDLFVALTREHGAPDAVALGRRIAVLFDGAIVGASMNGDLRAVSDARGTVAFLLESNRPEPLRLKRRPKTRSHGKARK